MMVRGGVLRPWAGAGQSSDVHFARRLACVSRSFCTQRPKGPDEFVDPAAKEEFDQIMDAIESGRCGKWKTSHAMKNH